VRGAVRIAVSKDSPAPFDDDTAVLLRLLHPTKATSPSRVLQLSSHQPTPLQLTGSDIMAAIKSFPPGSAGGLDGMRPQHLKDMTSSVTGAAGQQLIASLTEFCNLCLSGNVPIVVRPVFFGASLCALTRKGGGVRPIAVGLTLRRLIAKAACRVVKDKVVSNLLPNQLGFGVQQGAEAAAHAARSFLDNITTRQALLKIDFSNAFNTLRRDFMLSAILTEIPELSVSSTSVTLVIHSFVLDILHSCQTKDPNKATR